MITSIFKISIAKQILVKAREWGCSPSPPRQTFLRNLGFALLHLQVRCGTLERGSSCVQEDRWREREVSLRGRGIE